MKEIIRYAFTLALVCAISAASLAVVHRITSSKLITQALAEEELGFKAVMPQAESFQAVKAGEEILYYKALDIKGNLLGVVFKAIGKGYAGNIETVAGMDNAGMITDIKVISQNETPGLGSQVVENIFSDKFRNQPVETIGEIQAISGATISSRAVIDAVKAKAIEIKRMFKDGALPA